MSDDNVFGLSRAGGEPSHSPSADPAFDIGADTATALFHDAPVAMFIVDETGRIMRLNKAARLLFGFSQEELVGQPIERLIPQEMRRRHRQLRHAFMAQPVSRTMAEGRRLSALKKDGSRISVDIALNPVIVGPVVASSGRPKAVAVWITDSSARERAEIAELFVKELTHRARNMFSIISAISRQIAKSSADIAEFQPAFERRLNSLSASYQVFEKENWQAAPIGELVRSQVEFVLKDGTHQIDIDGCDIRLPASPAEYLGLAIHELATNALKHGALSVPEGRVYVRWAANKENRVFQFSWIERHGPAFPPPRRRGFGSVILNSIVPAACGGTAELKVTGTGMTWQLDAPLSILAQSHQTQFQQAPCMSQPKGTAT